MWFSITSTYSSSYSSPNFVSHFFAFFPMFSRTLTFWTIPNHIIMIETTRIQNSNSQNSMINLFLNCLVHPKSHTHPTPLTIPMCSLPWTQLKRWIPIRSMGCVHTHQGLLAIEGWGSPSHVQNVVQKTREDNQKVGKTSQVVSQVPMLRLEHDKIWAWWAWNVLSKNIMEMVCRHSKMESWSWTICCSMSCSNEKKHAKVGGGRRSHAMLRCCWKGNVLL